MSINVMDSQASVKTPAEFDALLVKYAKQNPEKHALKLASGEYDKQRKALGVAAKEEKAEAKAEEKPAHKPAK